MDRFRWLLHLLVFALLSVSAVFFITQLFNHNWIFALVWGVSSLIFWWLGLTSGVGPKK